MATFKISGPVRGSSRRPHLRVTEISPRMSSGCESFELLLLQHQSQLGVYAKSKECQPGVDPYSRLKYQLFLETSIVQSGIHPAREQGNTRMLYILHREVHRHIYVVHVRSRTDDSSSQRLSRNRHTCCQAILGLWISSSGQVAIRRSSGQAASKLAGRSSDE